MPLEFRNEATTALIKSLLLAIMVECLRLMLSYLQMPQQLAFKVSIFEDALGNRFEINFAVIDDWDVGQYR